MGPWSVVVLVALLVAQLPAGVPARAAPSQPHLKKGPIVVAAAAAVPVAAPTAPPEAGPTAPPEPAAAQVDAVAQASSSPAPTRSPAPTLTGPMPSPTIPPSPVPVPPTTPRPIPGSQFRRVVNTSAAAVRTSPSSHASVITKIPHGQIAGVLGVSSSGSWYRVNYRGKSGYVLKSKTQSISLVGTTLASQYVRVIAVARRQQHMEVWDHGQLMIISAVTTGRPELDTPIGSTKVQRREMPHLFQSPWAWPNQYWYPPGWAEFAVLFRAGGFYFHDTHYRPENGYGIGTQVPHIDPDGVERTGSRGCVNTPYWAVRQLFGWSQVGDQVVIVDR